MADKEEKGSTVMTETARPAGARFASFAAEDPPTTPGLAATITGDTEKRSTAYADSETGLTLHQDRQRAERHLLWKLDVVMIPFAALLYLSAYLDRGNLANARLQGLEAEVLDGSDTKYSIALSCFFITYIVFSIPGTLLAKAILPSTSISIGALIWSVAASSQAGAKTPAGLFVCRLFVGIGEAMFGQAMALHFSFWYKKKELSKRISLFIGAGALAGAFGGLISFGVSSIKKSPIPQWRILFLIEGIPSFVLAICVFFFLPSRPSESKYLTDDQRTLALTRLNEDSSLEGNHGIDRKAVVRALTDWKTYVVAVAYSCMNLGLGSVGGFLPTIIKGLGYTNADAQLFTVPPYAVALVFMVLLSAYSDRMQTRGIPVASVFCIGIVGWSVLLGVSPVEASHMALHARYFGCICIVTSGYASIPLIMSWQSANTGAESQRAVSLSMLNVIGQALSVLAAFSFPSNEGPKYVKGCALNIAFQVLGFLIVTGMTIYYRRENKRRDELEGPPAKGVTINTIEEYDLARGFRYVP